MIVQVLNRYFKDENNLKAQFKIIKVDDDIWEKQKEKVKKQIEELKKESEKSALEFTEKEIEQMPKEFKKLFKAGRVQAHIRKKSGIYEVRCTINRHAISASSKNLETAKAKFIEKLKAEDLNEIVYNSKTSLNTYMSEWLETAKKPYIKANTYNTYLQTFNKYISPTVGKKDLKAISAFDLQSLINEYVAQEKFRTAKGIYQLLSSVFDYAVADGKVRISPMKKVHCAIYEQETGAALTREEEKALVDEFLKNPDDLVVSAYVFILYTGLRRSELKSAKLQDGFVTVTTSKVRKGLKEKRRNIPVSPMLEKYLPKINLEKITKVFVDSLTDKFKKIVPGHKLHDLRHTFITRCQECGISREIVSLWAGHAADSSVTSKIYTHLEQNPSLQKNEIKKFSYTL